MRPVRTLGALVALVVALVALPRAGAAAPTLTIDPGSGPPDTRFVAHLAGFTPGEQIAFRLAAESESPGPLAIPAVTIRADGTYDLSILGLALPQGGYTLTALRASAAVATARFTVTPPGTPLPSPPATGGGGFLPGLPNTGAGGPPSPLLGGVLLAALGGLLGVAALARLARRRARPAVDDAPSGR